MSDSDASTEQRSILAPPVDRVRLEAMRYAMNEESAQYIAVMRTFTGDLSGLLSDQSSAEVAAALADEGIELDTDTMDTRLSYLVEHGNLARSPRETEARSLPVKRLAPSRLVDPPSFGSCPCPCKDGDEVDFAIEDGDDKVLVFEIREPARSRARRVRRGRPGRQHRARYRRIGSPTLPRRGWRSSALSYTLPTRTSGLVATTEPPR